MGDTINVSPITGGIITPLTDAATIAWAANQGYAYSVTLGGNNAFLTPTDMVIGAVYILFITQDATGNRVPTWAPDGFAFTAGVPPVLTTYGGSTDVLTFVSDGTKLILTAITKDVSTAVLPVSGLTATNNLADSIDLAWTNNDPTQTAVVIKRLDGLDIIVVATLPPDATSFSDDNGGDGFVPGYIPYYVYAERNLTLSAVATAQGSVSIPAPSDFVATTAGQAAHTAAASWVNNSESNVSFYVQRLNGVTWETTNTTGPGDIIATGLPVPSAIEYSFRVVGFIDSTDLESAPSNTSVVTGN